MPNASDAARGRSVAAGAVTYSNLFANAGPSERTVASSVDYAVRVEIARADDVLAEIEALRRARPGGVVATDGDGTLWSGDIGDDLLSAFIEHGRVEDVARDAIRRDAREFAIDTSGTPAAVAKRIWDASIAGTFPDERLYELTTWCFAGWSHDDVSAFARDVVVGTALASRLHAELARVLDGVRRSGVDVVLVSASPRAIVEAAASLVGIDVANVVAATPRWAGSTMLADVERPIPYGAGKVDGLRAKIGERAVYAAFGDNVFDIPMLAHAHLAIAVRPKPKLRARAAEVPALRELARD
jgi:phosphoserine phosphatase